MQPDSAIFVAEGPVTRTPTKRHARSRKPRASMLTIQKGLTQERWLKAFCAKGMGTVGVTCRKLGVGVSTWRGWMTEPVFAQAMQEAEAFVTDRVEATFIQRAEEKSDRLILAFMQSRKPELYGDPNGKGGTVTIDQRQQVAVQRTEFHVNSLSDQDLATLEQSVAQLLEKARLAAAGNTKPTLALEGEGKK